MAKKRLKMRTKFVVRSVDMQPAVRGFARLLNPELASAIDTTKRIIQAVNNDEPAAAVDPAEIRRIELREQLASIQAELTMLEGK